MVLLLWLTWVGVRLMVELDPGYCDVIDRAGLADVLQHAPKSVIVVDVAKVYHQALAAIPAPRKAA